MCVVDAEHLTALQTIAHVENAGFLFDVDFLSMTLSSASVPNLLAIGVLLLLPPVVLVVLLRRVDSGGAPNRHVAERGNSRSRRADDRLPDRTPRSARLRSGAHKSRHRAGRRSATWQS